MRMLNGVWFDTDKSAPGAVTTTNPYFVDCGTLRTMALCKSTLLNDDEKDNHTAYKLDKEIAKLHIEEFQKRFVISKQKD